jgi:hypothetical protein
MASRTVGFSAELIEGHKGVHAVILPFDPAEVWKEKPVALDERREGILVAGTLNGAPFEGWIGLRWGRHFIIVDEKIRKAGKMKVGDELEFAVAPTRSKSALAIAKEQAKLTTAPGRRRKAR